MWMTLLLAVGSVLLVISGFTWAARRESMVRAQQIAGLAIGPLGGLRAGTLAAVHARVTSSTPTTDPATGESVAYVEAVLQRRDTNQTLASVTEGASLDLEQDGSRAHVELTGAELAINLRELEASDGEPSARMRRVLERAGVEPPAPEPKARYVLIHRAIRIGASITVIGFPSRAERPVFNARSGLLVVTDGELGALQQREAGDLVAMNRMVRLAALVGVGLLVVGTILLAT